jgi:trans-2,3-dihydro-3-hydroxyanthranilate isomerase
VTRPGRFHSLDVFTDSKFSGKSLAVFADGDAFTLVEMLAIAREFNFFATAFMCAPRNPVNSVRLRVFSPQGERAFASHAVIGVAVMLAQTRAAEILSRREVVVVLEFGEEIFTCEVIRSSAGVSYAQFALNAIPRRQSEAPNFETLAPALAVFPDDLGFENHAPRIYSAFKPFTFIPLRSLAALERACPSAEGLTLLLGNTAGLYLYTADTIDPNSAVHARLFRPGGAEDPASGEALAAFAGVACEFERPNDGEHQIFIEQGHKMGRPSRLTLRMTVVDGGLADIQLGGQAIQICQGELKL